MTLQLVENSELHGPAELGLPLDGDLAIYVSALRSLAGNVGLGLD
jgi:hypothetical protein